MRDNASIGKVKQLHPAIREEVKALIEKAEECFPPNMAIRVTQGLRTIEEQDALYAQGRSKPGKIVTNARGGSSFHNYGLAIDFALIYDTDGNGTYETIKWDTKFDGDCDGHPDWMEVVEVFKAAGYEWGGDWISLKDYPHFQRAFGWTWRGLLESYKKGQFIEGTKYVRID